MLLVYYDQKLQKNAHVAYDDSAGNREGEFAETLSIYRL